MKIKVLLGCLLFSQVAGAASIALDAGLPEAPRAAAPLSSLALPLDVVSRAFKDSFDSGFDAPVLGNAITLNGKAYQPVILPSDATVTVGDALASMRGVTMDTRSHERGHRKGIYGPIAAWNAEICGYQFDGQFKQEGGELGAISIIFMPLRRAI